MKKFAFSSMIILCPIFYVNADIINDFLQEKLKLEKEIGSTGKMIIKVRLMIAQHKWIKTHVLQADYPFLFYEKVLKLQ